MKLTKFPSQAKLNTLGLNKKILYQHFKHGFKGGFGSDNIARDGIVKSIMNYSELEGELGAESLMMNDSPPITERETGRSHLGGRVETIPLKEVSVRHIQVKKISSGVHQIKATIPYIKNLRESYDSTYGIAKEKTQNDQKSNPSNVIHSSMKRESVSSRG